MPKLALAGIAALLVFAPNATAANFVVNRTDDPDNTTGACAVAGNCSLRQAVKAANAAGGPDVITFSVNTVNLTNAPDATGVSSTDSVTIDGGGGVTINVTGGQRAFQWKQPGGLDLTSTLKNVTIQGLTNGQFGGGSVVSGGLDPADTNTVTFDHVTFRNNVLTSGDGGAIQTGGNGVTTNVVDSTISGNSVPAGEDGGGIIVTGANLNVTRSTFSGNSARFGGGIYITPGAGAVNVVNSTFSGNSATSNGAAIQDDLNILNLSYSTIAGNTAPAGSGAVEINGGAGADIKGNVFTGNTPANCKGTVNLPTSAGFNFDSGTTCVNGANATDHASTTITLGALQDNGGPTLTRALPSGSLAIDAGGTGGSCTAIGGGALGTDQRGINRPQSAQCDSGAFEFVPPPANTVAPAISGTAEVGQVLTCSQGTWTGGTPQTFAFEWRRDGAAIPGASASTYTVTSADAGHSLTCRVTATNAGGSASADSLAVNVPAAGGGGGGGDGGGGGGGGGGGTTDTTPPAGTLEGKGKQDVDKLAITVGSNEAATASGQASVNVSGAKKPVTSKTVTASIPAGGTAKLKFKFKKKTLRKIKKAIAKSKKPKAKISVTLTDGSANSSTVNKTVKLKD